MKSGTESFEFRISQLFAEGKIAAVNGGMYAAVAESAIEGKLDREAIVRYLRRTGKTESSVQSIASRIWKLMLPENATVLAQMKSGEISVREARRAASTRQANPVEPTPLTYKRLSEAANCARSENIGLDDFCELARAIYKKL
jgi:hypothetical protein